MRIAIVDDETPARQSLTTMLTTFRPDCRLVGEANCVSTGIQLLRLAKPDIVLLDINLTDGSAFDLLDAFPNAGFKVVFTTAYDEFSLKAFRYNALDYLLKPILPRDLVASIDRATQRPLAEQSPKLVNLRNEAPNHQLSRLALHSADGLVFLRLDHIIRLEADSNYTTFHCSNHERHTVIRPLKEFEELLPETRFFRIHQSHLINFDFVKKVLKKDGGFVVMADGSQLPMARRRKDEFMAWLLENREDVA
ncbi:MAG: LytTR family DNA-binding domain-containing protein [Saprospiraceae bacterium]|nr:LytTR family DNA-binding domain-containing protein [Saprospiraceae bacterium]